jgi:hypothetical protein
MQVFVPFTTLREETRRALPDAEFVPMVDDYAYGRYFQQRWKEGRTFINVEHDVVPTMEVLQDMWRCAERLCSTRCANVLQPHNGTVPVYPASLGCSKISAEFIRAHSGIDWNIPWSKCDGVIPELNHFETCCVHGLVIHLHKFPF